MLTRGPSSPPSTLERHRHSPEGSVHPGQGSRAPSAVQHGGPPSELLSRPKGMRCCQGISHLIHKFGVGSGEALGRGMRKKLLTSLPHGMPMANWEIEIK